MCANLKVIQINVVYGNGSTGRIVKDIHEYLLEKGVDSKVYFGRKNAAPDPRIKKIAPEIICKLQSLRAKITGYAYGGAWYSTWKLKKYLEKEKPDVVHLHCINGFMVNVYDLLGYLHFEHIPTILTCHAEIMHTGGCGHSYSCDKWKCGCDGICPQRGTELPCSKLFDRSRQNWKLMNAAMKDYDELVVCCVSKWLEERVRQSPFMHSKRIITIENGLDTNLFQFRADSKQTFENLITEDRKVVLHVTPDFTSPIKGGKYVVELAKRNAEVKFIIVGKNSDSMPLPDNAVALPATNNQLELSRLYSMSDLTILTSKRETFSMVCAESLACGTPVLGFKAGAPEEIAIPEYSEFVEYGNIDSLNARLREMLSRNYDKINISKEARARYCRDIMAQKYYEEYIRLALD